jgi:isopropylmalate/citramalate/homocitrate synthase-like protein
LSDQDFFLSQYATKTKLNLPEKVIIYDTTLRDGEQTPGVTFTIEEKLSIARQLDVLGVDVIEAGFPITSKGEAESVNRIASEGLNARISALARPTRLDVDKALDTSVDYIHIFIATSDIHLKHKLKMSWDEVKEKSMESVEYAKEHGVKIEFSPEDATRTSVRRLNEITRIVTQAGADIVNIPDTVGVMTPRITYEFFKDLKNASETPLSAHAHNDFGLATANSIAAIEAGAEQVHVCVNGLGERAGNAPLEEVVMSLVAQYGIKTNINTKKISETSDLVQRLSGLYVLPMKPIIGDNAFTHEAGIHVHGMLGHPGAYEPLTPELVGKKRRFVAGKHTGKHAVKSMLEELGIGVDELQLNIISQEIKKLGDMGKKVSDADLYAIARNVMDIKEEDRVKLKQLLVVTGNTITPTASVTLLIDDEELHGSDIGNGPIDATIKAIRNLTGNLGGISLDKFSMKAITGGTDAVADVTVRMRKGQRYVTSSGVSGDTVMASVEAILKGMNRLLNNSKK